MKKTEDKILSVIEKYSMVADGDTVILAVSGGADSMCLLHFFNKFSRQKNFNMICAHVNHGIRGAEADADEAFVRSYCEKYNISFKCAHYDVPAVAESTGESEEQCGRRLRYDFFSSISNNAKIATAHNLNDCMETFIFNLSRGTGLKGLTGIPPVRDNIIRPLIECTREEIEAYLGCHGIEYVTDSTNLCDDYSRNKIRHNIIPVINELNSNFSSVFQNCISSLSDAEEYISKTVDSVFSDIIHDDRFSVERITALDNIIRNRLIIKIAYFFGARDVNSRHVDVINNFAEKGGAIMLPGNVTVMSDGNYIYTAPKNYPDIEIYEPYLCSRFKYDFPGCELNVEPVDKSEIKNYNNKQLSAMGYADANKLKSAVFRTRKQGDRFRFPYSEHSKSLKNLFKEKNITLSDRWGIPFLADDENILWINKVGISEYAKVDDMSTDIVKISCK